MITGCLTSSHLDPSEPKRSLAAHDHHDGLHHWEIPSADPDRIMPKSSAQPLAEESKGLTPMNDMTLNYHLMHPGKDPKSRDLASEAREPGLSRGP